MLYPVIVGLMQSISLAVVAGIFQVPPAYFLTQHTEFLRNYNTKTATINPYYFSILSQVNDKKLAERLFTAVKSPKIGHSMKLQHKAILIPFFARQIEKALNDFNPQVVHQHFATWSTQACHYCNRSDTPLILTLHGYDAFAASSLSYHPYKELLSRQACKALKQATVVFAVSEFLGKQALKAGVSPQKIQILYQGVDTDFFSPPTLVNSSKPENPIPQVIAVGHLTEQKGVVDLLQASIRIAKMFPHQLIFAGSGPLSSTILSAQSEHPHIFLRGQLNRQQILELYQQADLHVLATKPSNDGRREAAGLVTLEAQSCALPVITTNCGGAPEMLIPNKTGLVANFNDVNSLSAALATMLDMSTTDRRIMGKYGRDFVVANRSMQSTAIRLGNFYQQLSN